MAEGIKVAVQNRKAFHDYTIEESYEAGMELFGTEVKSIRLGKANLKDSYVAIRRGEAFAVGMHISPYEKGNIFNRDPMRDKRLLLHRAEIRKLQAAVMQDGYSIVPLKVYFVKGRAKMEIALAKGKKLYDKRLALKEKAEWRDEERGRGE